MGGCCSCEPMVYTTRTLKVCQILAITAFFLVAGSVLGLPTFVIMICSLCMNLSVGWFLIASIFACLAAAQSGATAYYLLNWRDFWDDIIAEIRDDLDKDGLDQEDVDRIYNNFQDYEFFGYIAIGITALWLLCALLLCFFAGSYKRALQEASQQDHMTQGGIERQEQPRRARKSSQKSAITPIEAATLDSYSYYDTNESLA